MPGFVPFGNRVSSLVEARGWSLQALRPRVQNVSDYRFDLITRAFDFPTSEEAHEFALALEVSLSVVEGSNNLESQNYYALASLLKRRDALQQFTDGWREVRKATLESSHHNGRPFDEQTLLELIESRPLVTVGSFSVCYKCGNRAVGDNGRCRVCRYVQDVD